jgi:hypothetical protein
MRLGKNIMLLEVILLLCFEATCKPYKMHKAFTVAVLTKETLKFACEM